MEAGVGTWQKLWVPMFSQCPGPVLSNWGLEAIFGSFQNIPEDSYPLHSPWVVRGFIDDRRTKACRLSFLSSHQAWENNSNTGPEWSVMEREGSSRNTWWDTQGAQWRWIKHLKPQDAKVSYLEGILEVSWSCSLNMYTWGRLERALLIFLKKEGRKNLLDPFPSPVS